MIDYEAKAEELWNECSVEDRSNDQIAMMAKFLRESAAQALEDAATGAGCECSSAAPVECALCSHAMHLRSKAAALRQPISVTQEEEGK